jgi:L-amino acid N-acyltransferase YncA
VIARCKELGYRQMVAVIGGRETVGSIRLHERLGFSHIGILPAVGFKFGRWIDIILMQRQLGPGSDTLPAPATPDSGPSA